MADCGSWNPVSLQDPQPYYPNYIIPSKAELDAMGPKEFNPWRTKAKHMLLAFFQKLWRYKHFTREQKDYLQAMLRAAQDAIFGNEETHPEDYGCGSSKHKKHWDMSIDVAASWEASKPDWYV